MTGVTSALVGAMLQAGSPAANASAAASRAARLKVTAGPSVETLQGTAMTLPLPGGSGDYLRVNALGAVGVSAHDGHTVWQLSAGSLFSDWHLRLTSAKDGPVTPNPQVPLVRLSPNPFRLSDAQQHGIADLHPAAAGYLAGSRVPVVAVAETAGAQPGSVNLQWPFSVPGSHLHEGTFVTLLNGSTGQYLYSQLYPGQITQLAITGGRLIVGEETGDRRAANWAPGGPARRSRRWPSASPAAASWPARPGPTPPARRGRPCWTCRWPGTTSP